MSPVEATSPAHFLSPSSPSPVSLGSLFSKDEAELEENLETSLATTELFPVPSDASSDS